VLLVRRERRGEQSSSIVYRERAAKVAIRRASTRENTSEKAPPALLAGAYLIRIT